MSARYQSFLAEHATPWWRHIDRVLLALLVTALVWAAFAHLDQVAVASGEVIPQSKVKVIQHFEGGIIERIEVAEGQHVRPNDTLLVLNLAAAGMNREEMQVRLDSLELVRIRLEAEATDRPPHFPQEMVRDRPGLVQAEKDAYAAQTAEFESGLAVVDRQIAQRRKEVAELQARLSSAERELDLARSELQMKRNLLKEDLTSKLDVLNTEQRAAKLEGDAAVARQSVPRAHEALSEARAHHDEVVSAYRRRAQEKLSETDHEIARLKEQLSIAQDQVKRSIVRSPIDGVIKNMRYVTIGGVVKAGEPIMEIVPFEESLVVEARLSPADRGYVAEGQPVQVKVSAFDFVRFGTLQGKVSSIAADTINDPDAGPYYKVVVTTNSSHLGPDPGMYRIQPGMQTTVDIRVGRQTVLQYLIRPVLKLRYDAFREP
ncbi:MAG: HlyD family type I secretion periplasmic adaptor subunit [Actinomycetota bacterium]